MTTTRQDRQFGEDMIPDGFRDSLLPLAIDWIQSNLEPGDVFTDSVLEAWAEANGYLKEAE